MADETFDSVLSGVKDEAVAQDSAPKPAATAAPSSPLSSAPTDNGLSNVLQGVKDRANPPAPTPEQPVPPQTEDEVLKSAQAKRQQTAWVAQSGDAASAVTAQAVKRIASAFGHGAFEAAGEGATALLHPVSGAESITDNDVKIKGEDTWINNINQAVVTHAVNSMGIGLQVVNGLNDLISTPFSAAISAAQQAGEETGSEGLQKGAAFLSQPEMMGVLGGVGAEEIHSALAGGSSAIRDFVTKPPLPAEMYRAVNNGIIEPSDAGIKAEAAQALPAIDRVQRLASQKGLVTSEVTPGVHDIVRQYNPELFASYDKLVPQIETLRNTIHDPEVLGKEYDDKLAELKSQRADNLRVSTNLEGDDLNKAVQDSQAKDSEIDTAIKELGSRNQYITKGREETQDQFLQLDAQLRDITPQVNAAYAEALPKAREAAFAVPSEAKPFESDVTQPVEQKAVEAASTFDIAADVKKKLSSEGRTKDQAEAESQVIAARYETAAKNGWTPGSAEEVYKRHMAEIKATRAAKQTTDKALELAQGDKILDPETQGLIDKQAHDSLTEQLKEKGYTQDQIKDFIDRAKTGNLTRKESRLSNSITNLAKSLNQSNRGDILLASKNSGKAIIKLFKKNDASTLMHEMAHHWLDEMVTWEKAEDAPKDLKDHMQAVRDWLGADTGSFSGFTKSQHEMWARGFEKYLREGVAPSVKLANAFAHFKDWLSKIYETATKLRVDISPAIRNVFDHMLAVNPERTIAEGHGPAAELASVHETDAKLTTPVEADQVRDTVAKEIDKTAKLHDPEVADVIKNAEQTGSLPETASSSTESSTAIREPAREGSTGEPNPVVEGGSGAGSEGVGSRTESTTERGGTTPDEKPIRSKPVDKLVDKAGNIVLKNLTTDQEILSGLKLMAEKTPYLDHDVVGDVQVGELAREIGLKNPDAALAKLKGLAADDGVPLASYVRAARDMLANASKEVRDFSSKVKGGTDADFQNAIMAKDRFMMIASTVSETANEIGRAMRAFQDISGTKKSSDELTELLQQSGSDRAKMETLFQLIASKGAEGLESQVAKLIQNSNKPGFWDSIAEIKRCSILSNYITHTLWLAGTGFNLTFKALVLDTLGGLHNNIGMLMGREDTGSRVYGGVEGLYRTITQGLPSILSKTGTALTSGKTVLRPYEGEFDTQLATGGIRKTLDIDPTHLRTAVESAFNPSDHPDIKELQDKISDAVAKGDTVKSSVLQERLKSVTEEHLHTLTQMIAARMQSKLKSWGDLVDDTSHFGASAASAVSTLGDKLLSPDFYKDKAAIEFRRSEGKAAPDVYVKGLNVLPYGSVLRGSSGRIYSTMHTFAREVAANIETIQEARRVGVSEGKTGTELNSRISELLADPTKDMMDRVNHITNKQTLMSNESGFAKWVTRARSNFDAATGTKIGSFLFPVVGIPAEATHQTVIESSPVGLLSKTQRGKVLRSEGVSALEQERAQVKMVAGSALLGVGAWMYSKGNATPSSSVNYNQEEERLTAGKQSGSIRIGDWMVSTAHTPVIGTLISTGADLAHIAAVSSGEDLSDKLTPATQSAVNNFFLHENALVELASLMDVMRGKTGVEGYLKNMAVSAVVPQFLKATDDLQDPEVRESKSLMSSVLSKLPWESEDLSPKINPLTGEPIVKSPLHVSSANGDPIAQGLMDIHIYPTTPHPEINNVQLNPQQLSEYSSVKGHILHSGMQMLMQGDGKDDYEQADYAGKRKMAMKIENHASQCAKSYMFNKYPELLKDANDKYEASCASELE